MKRPSETFNLGIVGACGRGSAFAAACDAIPRVSIHAVCDTNEEELAGARDRLGAREQYTDYQTMIETSDLDAVIIGTPMHFHAPMAIAALGRNLHVLSEVTAAVSVEECRRLTEACRRSQALYTMAENYVYTKPNAIVREMVRRGLFGTPYFAEGEYLHELKHMNEVTTPWRRRWQTGIDGITYGTHSLGPILSWMPGDRVVRVCCEGTGVRHADRTETPYCQASSTMLCKTANDALIKIRVDMLSDRPHAMTNYQLQGTDACYESARAPGESDRVWIRGRSETADAWTDLERLAAEFLPAEWSEHAERAAATGHGGGDYFVLLEFVNAATGSAANPVDIDRAMDMTLPGLISQDSIREGGRWIDVPDSREW